MMISDLEGNGYCKPFYVYYEKKRRIRVVQNETLH